MNRMTLLLTSLVLFVATLAWAAMAPATSAGSPAYGTDVQIEPSGKPQGGFSIWVKVTDLSSGAVVAAPRILIPAGENGETRSDLPDQSTVTMSAKVDSATHTATYSIAFKRGEQVLTSHTAKVALP